MLGVAVTIQCENCYDMGIVQEGMGMYSMDNCRGSRKAPEKGTWRADTQVNSREKNKNVSKQIEPHVQRPRGQEKGFKELKEVPNGRW